MPTTQAGLALGRLYDFIGVGAANPINVSNANAIGILVEASGASTITVQGSKSFSSGYVNWTAANGFSQPTTWYQNTANDGTAQWTKQTASWSTATLTLAGTSGYMSYVEFYATQFADGYKYLKVSANANTTYIVLIAHDLAVARTPANLAKLGA